MISRATHRQPGLMFFGKISWVVKGNRMNDQTCSGERGQLISISLSFNSSLIRNLSAIPGKPQQEKINHARFM